MQRTINSKRSAVLFCFKLFFTIQNFVQSQPAYAKLLNYKRLRHNFFKIKKYLKFIFIC